MTLVEKLQNLPDSPRVYLKENIKGHVICVSHPPGEVSGGENHLLL